MEKLIEQSPAQKYVIKEILNKKNTMNTTQVNINAINETVDGINFNVESESVRLTSSHYKLQSGLWKWTYGDKVEEDTWEMSKEHAKLTAEENIKQIVINKLDNKIIDFWFDVIKKIDKLDKLNLHWTIIGCIKTLKEDWQLIGLEAYDVYGNYYTATSETYISNPEIITKDIKGIENHGKI